MEKTEGFSSCLHFLLPVKFPRSAERRRHFLGRLSYQSFPSLRRVRGDELFNLERDERAQNPVLAPPSAALWSRLAPDDLHTFPSPIRVPDGENTTTLASRRPDRNARAYFVRVAKTVTIKQGDVQAVAGIVVCFVCDSRLGPGRTPRSTARSCRCRAPERTFPYGEKYTVID